MRLFHSISSYDLGPSVVTVGVFDGVHLGHRAVVSELRRRAAERGAAAVVVTFGNHPRSFFAPGSPVGLLTTPAEKADLLAAQGVDAVVFVPFDDSVVGMPYADFVARELVGGLRARGLVMGFDHTLGQGRRGDFGHVRALGAGMGLPVWQAPRFSPAAGGSEVSSSRVRALISEGDVAAAARLLGYRYGLQATVVRGRQVGRGLGFPTANLVPADAQKILPPHGVYAAFVTVAGRCHGAMVNHGVRPTLADGRGATLEASLFDFDGDLYGASLRVDFESRLRGERRFAGLGDLSRQLSLDALAARRALDLL